MKNKKLIAVILAAVVLLGAIAFVILAIPSGKNREDGRKTVMCSFYPLYIFAENVLDGAEDISVICMTPQSTGCLHDYQLLAGDMQKLCSADAFIICGAGMEQFLDKVTEQRADLYTVDCSTGIELIREEEHHHHGDDDADEDEDEVNAHFWLDPMRAIQMVENMANGLMERYPEHAELIRTNTEAYKARLTALDEKLQAGLAALARRDIVTFHEAFPYFAQRYGLEIVAVMTLEPEESLSEKAMTELADTVRAHDCPPLFTEPVYSSVAAEVVSKETGARVYRLDPVVNGSYEKDAYEKAMLSNMETLREALGVAE